MREIRSRAALRRVASFALLVAASTALSALLAGCASTAAATYSKEPRKVSGCRYEEVHYEEVWKCEPNPATPGRLLCGYRDTRVPDRWWLEYETGEPRLAEREECMLEGERKRWECGGPDGFVFLDEPPVECPVTG